MQSDTERKTHSPNTSDMQREGHCMSAIIPDSAGPSMTALVTINRPSPKRLFRALPRKHNRRNVSNRTTDVAMVLPKVKDLLDSELK